ncbi:zinc finger, C2H2-type transcription factor [Pseudohyphozyma bogoriensis]|nr:zinc finger, C2H2-type transcription factor [Pseudohyphozyma bogoriensis]
MAPVVIPNGFPCDQCPAKFSRKEYVQRHRLAKHTTTRSYVCAACDRSYTRSDLLRRHEKLCNGEAGTKPKRAKTSATSSSSAATSSSNSSTSSNTSPSSTSNTDLDVESPPVPPPSTSTALFDDLYLPTPTSTTDDPLSLLSQLAPEPGSNGGLVGDWWTETAAGGTGSGGPTFANMSMWNPAENALALASTSSTLDLPSLDLGLDPLLAPSNSIENSPEAQALASYFTQGGVGGITALELNFNYQPSFMAPHLFETQYVHDVDDPRFFLPKEKFHMTYLAPWQIPRMDTLSRYASRAAKEWLPKVPVLHLPTLELATMPVSAAFAFSVVGSTLDAEGEQFSQDMLGQKRGHIVEAIARLNLDLHNKFGFIQAMLLYQLIGLFHKDEAERAKSYPYHGSLVFMVRQLKLVEEISKEPMPVITPQLEGEELEKAWKLWVKQETYRRSTEPLTLFSDIAMDLPVRDCLWNAPTAQDWLTTYLSPFTPKPVKFLDAIHALLLPSPPPPYSSAGLLLGDLGNLSTLSHLILSRALVYLEGKARRRKAEEDPFKVNRVGGSWTEVQLGDEVVDQLKRIEGGKKVMKALPGSERKLWGHLYSIEEIVES